MDRLFHALADATRRDIVRRVLDGEQSISDLARRYPMSMTAVQKHVAVLEGAGWSRSTDGDASSGSAGGWTPCTEPGASSTSTNDSGVTVSSASATCSPSRTKENLHERDGCGEGPGRVDDDRHRRVRRHGSIGRGNCGLTPASWSGGGVRPPTRRPSSSTSSPSVVVTYFMTSPEGDRFHGWWEVIEAEPPRDLLVEDGFADAEGTPNPDLPSTLMRIRIEDRPSGGVLVTIVSTFPTIEALQQLLAMGMAEGCARRWVRSTGSSPADAAHGPGTRDVPGVRQRRSEVLVEQDHVAVGVDQHEARRTGRGLVGLAHQCEALGLQGALDVADVGELRRPVARRCPTRG